MSVSFAGSKAREEAKQRVNAESDCHGEEEITCLYFVYSLGMTCLTQLFSRKVADTYDENAVSKHLHIYIMLKRCIITEFYRVWGNHT